MIRKSILIVFLITFSYTQNDQLDSISVKDSWCGFDKVQHATFSFLLVLGIQNIRCDYPKNSCLFRVGSFRSIPSTFPVRGTREFVYISKECFLFRAGIIRRSESTRCTHVCAPVPRIFFVVLFKIQKCMNIAGLGHHFLSFDDPWTKSAKCWESEIFGGIIRRIHVFFGWGHFVQFHQHFPCV